MLLNDWRGRNKKILLTVDRIVGPLTIGVILDFQTTHALVSDGRVDPADPSVKKLVPAFAES
jgi:hypothetical protein